MRDTIYKTTVVLLYLLALLPASPASAYILSGGHILQLMAGSQGKTKHIRVHQHIDVFDPQVSNGKLTLPETIYYSFPIKFRSEINAEPIQRIHIAYRQAALTVTDKRVTSTSGSLFDGYKDLLLLRSRYALERRLKDVGIDTGVSSIGRFNDTIALIIGARYPDETVPQVWVEKDTFRPLRWIIKVDEPLLRDFEIRYLQWQQTGDAWYPWRVEFYENQMLVRRISVDRLVPKKTLAPELFDVAALKKQVEVSADLPPTTEQSEGIEVQDTIDNFKKRFE